jgi:hypothetical protein
MHGEVYERIADVPARLWDAAAPQAFFFQRTFLEVMEESAVEEARYRYLVLREDETSVGREDQAPAGLAVLSRFLLKLDLLSGDPWVRRLRCWLPHALDVPMICCGVPASFGQHHLHVTRPERTAEAVRCVHQRMDAWAAETQCALLVWKEWDPGQGLREHARREGFLVLPTLPDHTLTGLGGDVSGFLAGLRSPYRRKYRAAAALLRGPGPVWTEGPLRLAEARFDATAAAAFYRGYARVMERTSVRLETYPPSFFSNLARSSLDVRTLDLSHALSGQALTAMLIASGPVLTFVLISKERARYDDALYTLMLQCIVLYAVARGFEELRLGQTSSWAKCSVGARPRRLETFIRMRGPLKHRALALFGGLLFPEVDTRHFHVFKGEGAAEE